MTKYDKWHGDLPNYKTAVVTNPNFKCPCCGGKDVLEDEIDEIHGDYRYVCKNPECKTTWIVEGPDA